MADKTYRIMVINPGSTSTKVGVFDGETEVFTKNVAHEASKLAEFASVSDQMPYRRDLILDALKENGVEHLHLAARGLGCFPAVFAALLSDKVESLTLYDAPESYLSMAKKRITRWPQSCMVPGILKFTDLPEVYAAVEAEKKLSMVNFVNEPVPEV